MRPPEADVGGVGGEPSRSPPRTSGKPVDLQSFPLVCHQLVTKLQVAG